MTITFKQFLEATSLSDEEFQAIEEGLSDVPGFGWLKGPDNKAKIDKIKAERDKLKNRRDKLAMQKAAELDGWLDKATEKMPALRDKDDDARGPYDNDREANKFSSKLAKMPSMSGR